MRSVLGSRDGNPYEGMLSWAKKNPVNRDSEMLQSLIIEPKL
jgi:hypothetical protein